jgi:hypothetical protein
VTELEIVAEKVLAATSPAEVFGLDAQKDYRRMAFVLHEDRYQGESEKRRARDAFSRLGDLWRKASRPASAERVEFSTRRIAYSLGDRLHSGGTCGVLRGVARPLAAGLSGSEIIARVPHSAADNDLMEREARNLATIAASVRRSPEGEEHLGRRIPALLESVQVEEPGAKVRRRVNAFALPAAFAEGWVSLVEVRAACPAGVDPRHAVWIWNRTLEALILAHGSGIAHGAVTPQHVLVHPPSHLGQVFDWTASGKPGTRLPYRDSKWSAWQSGDFATVGADLRSAAWCAVYVLGGDPNTSEIPATVPDALRNLLDRSLQPRPSFLTATATRDELRRVARSLYGEPKFIPFTM